MTPFNKLRQQWAIVRLMADQQERLEIEQCKAADARERLRAISPTISQQVFAEQRSAA